MTTVYIYQTTTQQNTAPHCWANSWAATNIKAQGSNDTLQLPCDSANKCAVTIVNLGTERACHKFHKTDDGAQYLFHGEPRSITLDLTNDITLDLWSSEAALDYPPYATLTLTKNTPSPLSADHRPLPPPAKEHPHPDGDRGGIRASPSTVQGTNDVKTREVTLYMTTTGWTSDTTAKANAWAARNIVDVRTNDTETLVQLIKEEGEVCDLTLINLGTQTASYELGNDRGDLGNNGVARWAGLELSQDVTLNLHSTSSAPQTGEGSPGFTAPYRTLTLTKVSPGI